MHGNMTFKFKFNSIFILYFKSFPFLKNLHKFDGFSIDFSLDIHPIRRICYTNYALAVRSLIGRKPISLNLIPLFGEGGRRIYITSGDYATLMTPIVITNLIMRKGNMSLVRQCWSRIWHRIWIKSDTSSRRISDKKEGKHVDSLTK